MTELTHLENEIATQILLVNGQRVMLDTDLAKIYGVETRVLNQAVRRNRHRFPSDFMLELSEADVANLKSQIVISSWGGRRKGYLAFTEHGAVMLASVLNSPTAVEASIIVVRAFVRLRQFMALHYALEDRLNDLEEDVKTILDEHSDQIRILLDSIGQLMQTSVLPRTPIGFKK
jgi:hypothetical protein